MIPAINFNEAQWLKLVFLLADTQQWINDMARDAFLQLPVTDKKKCFRKTYYLTAEAMAHIIERHYYKINRHPQTGKFHLPVIEIVQLIRDAAELPVTHVPGSLNFQRTMQTGNLIGYDKDGNPTTIVTIINDAGGKIITAFPGLLITC
jgi:hypothetical protein